MRKPKRGLARRRQNQQAAILANTERASRLARLAVFNAVNISETARIATQAPEHLLTNWQRKRWAKDNYTMLDAKRLAYYRQLQSDKLAK